MKARRVTNSQGDMVWNVQPLRENRKHVVDPIEHPLDPTHTCRTRTLPAGSAEGR